MDNFHSTRQSILTVGDKEILITVRSDGRIEVHISAYNCLTVSSDTWEKIVEAVAITQELPVKTVNIP